MRPISEATQAVLKSQKLTGQNRFGYELRLEGTEYYSPVKDKKNVTIANGAADYCIRADGKALVAYSSGNNIYLATMAENEMLSENYRATQSGTLFTTISGSSSDNFIKLTRIKSGKIILLISEGTGANGLFKITQYHSASGLGDDFINKGIVFSHMVKTNSIIESHSVCKIAEKSDGSLYFSATTRTDYDASTTLPDLRTFVSTNDGESWDLARNTYNLYERPRFTNGCITISNELVDLVITGAFDEYDINTLLHIGSNGTWSTQSKNFGFRGFFDLGDDLENIYVITNNTQYSTVVYYRNKSEITSIADFLDFTKLKILIELPGEYAGTGQMSVSPIGNIHYWFSYLYITSVVALIREVYSAVMEVSSISISKGRGGSNTADIKASNKNGILNPKNPDNPLYGILQTNKQIKIKQGYGLDLIESFTGRIDSFEMSTWPQETAISLRDNLKLALDQTVTYQNQHTVEFALQPIENIVQYLCYLAGMEVGEVEPTGIQVEKTFSWESYGDAFQFLGDLASFEWGCDEYGKFYFRRDYQPANMVVAYTFEEGVDIASLKYSIKDDDLYYKVVVFGEDSNKSVISYEAPFLDAASYNILPQKILKIDATEARTLDELRKIAERAIALMQSRTVVVSFSSIGVPWLQVGDFIGIYERSTGASSVYRISGLNLQMGTDSFTMDIEASYYGDSIVPGELPTGTATQTIAPSINLIPEMTSNNAPSGAAKASSVYSSAFEPWQAFNSSAEDLYWNSITNTGWIEYQFPQKMIIDKYIIKARQLTSYNDAMPKNWTFEGFDGSKWVTLDTRTNQTAWGAYETRTYLVTNTTAYSKYRLNVSRNNGYNRLQIEQLAMYYGGGA